jgi:hypothetical protein
MVSWGGTKLLGKISIVGELNRVKIFDILIKEQSSLFSLGQADRGF